MELFSPGHLIPLLIVAGFLFFGWKQLPDMSRSLGRSLRIFKTEIKGMTEDDKAREVTASSSPAAVEPGPEAAPPAPTASVTPQEPASVPSTENPAAPPNS